VIVRAFDVPGSVKDVIESCGVPHTEVDLILANGESVGFSYRVADGDRISVYPVFESFDISPILRVRSQPLRRVRFVLDGHLGTLARHLRLLGFDSLWSNAWADRELVAISTDQHATLLTRDRGLLKHRAVTHGYCVRSTDPRGQLREVIRRFHLADRVAPFTRCMRCNGLLEAVKKADVEHRLPPRTREHFDYYRTCTGCQQIYWQGAHYRRLVEIVEEARENDRTQSRGTPGTGNGE
jgi:uncharacterized protein with PIN domain